METRKFQNLNKSINLSPTVRSVNEELYSDIEINAAQIANAILKRHPEYGKGSKQPKRLTVPKSDSGLSEAPSDPSSMTGTMDYWLSEIQNIYDDKKVTILHGRIVLIALSILNPEIYNQLSKNGFLTSIIKELKEPLGDLLSAHGQTLAIRRFNKDIASLVKKTPKKISTSDRIGSYSDSPEEKVENDKLGRAAYARYLVKRILAVDPNDAFSMHIGGPWGSGKSTLLNFMKTELKKDSKNKWVIVEFNAWRNQHLNPPWWPLLDAIYDEGKQYLSWWRQLNESLWRISIGKTFLPFLIFLTAVIILYIINSVNDHSENSKDLVDTLTANGAILAAILALYSGFQGIRNIFTSKSSRTIESYLETTTNPMQDISQKFGDLVRNLGKNKDENKGTRIAVIIDDLDRCQTDYVVELLEGIQTIFRQNNVVFIVAADQRWLHACFEESYQKLKAHVQERGKGLGTLFLEKVFQFVVPIPAIPDKVSEEFWHDLLQRKKGKETAKVDALRENARDKAEQMSSETELLEELSKDTILSPVEKQLIREETVVRLAAPELAENIENHTLAPFAKLLNPNPRAMKRLVNAYSVNRALSTLGRLDIPQKELALWTILAMRWPSLARHLEKNPQDIEHIKLSNEDSQKKLADSGMDEKLAVLFTDNSVLKVVNENHLGVKLTPDKIVQCAKLRM